MSLPLRLLLCPLLLLVAATLSAQERRFRIVEYNAENVFDTLSTEGHADAEFTPANSIGVNSRALPAPSLPSAAYNPQHWWRSAKWKTTPC